MKIAVLGAGGFIGSHMVERLLAEESYSVIGLDVSDEKLDGLPTGQLEFHKANIVNDSELVDDIVRRADVVVDLIAFANPSIYVSAPSKVFELNFVQNLRVIEACREQGTRIIQYSTSEVYGRPTAPLYNEDESELIMGPIGKHRWIYACSKQLLERALHAYGLDGALDYTIARPFNFIGPRLDYLVPAGSTGGPRVFAHFMSALLTGGPMYLVDGGHAHRSFTHIDDATDAFMCLLTHPAARNEVFNIGNPDINITIRDLAVLMKELYGELTGASSACDLVEIPGEEFYGTGYEDTDRVPPDISKLRALGYEPRYDLRATLENAMSYYLESFDSSLLEPASHRA